LEPIFQQKIFDPGRRARKRFKIFKNCKFKAAYSKTIKK